jgi:hypothetical protein
MENNIPKKEAIEKNCLLYSSLNVRTSMMTKHYGQKLTGPQILGFL